MKYNPWRNPMEVNPGEHFRPLRAQIQGIKSEERHWSNGFRILKRYILFQKQRNRRDSDSKQNSSLSSALQIHIIWIVSLFELCYKLSDVTWRHWAHFWLTFSGQPLARLWECSQFGGQNKRNFRFCKKILFCTPDWLHSHRPARGL